MVLIVKRETLCEFVTDQSDLSPKLDSMDTSNLSKDQSLLLLSQKQMNYYKGGSI